ncbi:hypothetical protein GXW82_02595 [Streptacidiphilus sp. 4-A2]|nr:hypothetical protein [Streptacidiphilus sp. 4-A2]
MSCPVQSITADPGGGSDINVAPGCWAANNVDVPNLGFPFNGSGLPALDGVSYLENAYQLLTAPGQFYLDQRAGYLYYIPTPGQDMHSADVELPTLQTLVSLDGTPGHLSPVNQDAQGASYTGSWATSSGRGYGTWATTWPIRPRTVPRSPTPSPEPVWRFWVRRTPTRAASVRPWTVSRTPGSTGPRPAPPAWPSRWSTRCRACLPAAMPSR